MQYKTITATHNLVHKKSNIDMISQKISIEYSNIITEQAKEGWMFMGIHPINIIRRFGCKDLLLSCIFIYKCRKFQVDVLVFCREGDPNETPTPENTVKHKSAGEMMKKTGSAMINATQGATDFIKSGEAMDKFNSLKGKIQSKIPGNKSDDEFQ